MTHLLSFIICILIGFSSYAIDLSDYQQQIALCHPGQYPILTKQLTDPVSTHLDALSGGHLRLGIISCPYDHIKTYQQHGLIAAGIKDLTQEPLELS